MLRRAFLQGLLIALASLVTANAASLPTPWVDTLPAIRLECRMSSQASGKHSRQLYEIRLQPRRQVTYTIEGVRRIYVRFLAEPVSDGTMSVQYTVLVPSGPSFQAYGPNRMVIGQNAGAVPFDFYLEDTSVQITLSEAGAPAVRQVVAATPTGPAHHICPHCHGTGICMACNGKGGRVCNICDGTGICQHCHGTAVCQNCAGTGKVFGRVCPVCHGTGACQFCNDRGDDDHVGDGKCAACHGTGFYTRCVMCNGTGKCYYCGGTGEL
ncbi:MAG: hypothetical protein ACYCW6_07250 [Candidatus Xenobia bacterium]